MRFAYVTAALVLVGCADQGDEGMTVINNTAVSGGECALSGEPGQPFRSHGQIYAYSSLGYTLTPLIQSRVTATIGGGSGSSAGTDELQRTIQLRGADVKLTVKATTIKDAAGNYRSNTTERAIAPFSVLFSGSLPPGGTVNVGFEVITPLLLRDIATNSGANVTGGENFNSEVLAEVTILGDLGGNQIKSSPFNYPISVCSDCVVVNLGACPVTGSVDEGNACNPFQDGSVGCCTDASNNLVCPASTM